MEVLILSCATGGGHNAAGAAIKDELINRGNNVRLLDPYSLVSETLPARVGNAYVKTAQRAPQIFGLAYKAGNVVRNISCKSPVYWANVRVAEKLAEYLETHHFDEIITPHLFPAEMLTYLKRHGTALPPTVFVATDYTCIPFTEETECDYYIIPGKEQEAEFEARGISRDRLFPLGIPVADAFYGTMTKEEARAALGLGLDQKYILVTGGSIGAGALEETAQIILEYCRKNHRRDVEMIMVCGNNERLYERLSSLYGEEIMLLKQTEQMPLYMKACDVFISKPGGLSSTEAAVTGVPFIQITPIPGCESHNMRFFTEKGMAIGVEDIQKELGPALGRFSDREEIEKMRAAQRKGISNHALYEICDWLEQKVCRN